MTLRIVVTGWTGQIVRAMLERVPTGVEIVALRRPELDLAIPKTVAPTLRAARPDVIVNAAAYTAVDQAESEPDNDGEGAPRGHDLKQWLFGTVQIATGAALFPLEDYKGDIITDLFGDLSYFADADAFWALQNAAIASVKDELAGKGWKVTVLERGAHFQSWQYAEVTLEDGGEAFRKLVLGHERYGDGERQDAEECAKHGVRAGWWSSGLSKRRMRRSLVGCFWPGFTQAIWLRPQIGCCALSSTHRVLLCSRGRSAFAPWPPGRLGVKTKE